MDVSREVARVHPMKNHVLRVVQQLDGVGMLRVDRSKYQMPGGHAWSDAGRGLHDHCDT